MNHVQILFWWWWADINGTLGSVGYEIPHVFDPIENSRWPQVHLNNVQNEISELWICSSPFLSYFLYPLVKVVSDLYRSQSSCHPVFSAQYLMQPFFRDPALSLAAIPPLVLLIESCGNLFEPNHVPPHLDFIDQPTTLRLISALLPVAAFRLYLFLEELFLHLGVLLNGCLYGLTDVLLKKP